jgi:hypothetical protein
MKKFLIEAYLDDKPVDRQYAEFLKEARAWSDIFIAHAQNMTYGSGRFSTETYELGPDLRIIESVQYTPDILVCAYFRETA